MATRFYFGPNGAPTISPTFSAGWELTSQASKMSLIRSKPGWFELLGRTDNATTGVQDVLAYQFTSGPLQAQAISGTVKGQFRASENSATGDYRAQMRLYVVSGDGTTVRGVLLELDEGALTSEFVLSTLTNRKFPLAWAGAGAALTLVNALDGDRLVLEIGARTHNATTTPVTFNLEIRSDAASDLPEDETDTTALNSWVELSHDVLYKMGDDARLVGPKADQAFTTGLPSKVPPDGDSSLERFETTIDFVTLPAQKRGRSRAKNVAPLGSPAQVPPVGASSTMDDIDQLQTLTSLDTKVMRGGSTLAFAPGTGAVGGVRFMYKMRGVDSGAPAPGYVTWEADFRDYGGAQSASAQPAIVGSLVGGSVVVVSQWELS